MKTSQKSFKCCPLWITFKQIVTVLGELQTYQDDDDESYSEYYVYDCESTTFMNGILYCFDIIGDNCQS